MRVLVIGGAGYIGSHMVKMLLDAGHRVVVVDDLSTGFRDAIPGGEFVEGSVSNRALLDTVLSARRFDGAMHFASFIQVGESVVHPSEYYRNNVSNTIDLLDALVRHGVDRLIFSSSAAIFGEPQRLPIDEDHSKGPGNPYGRSKWMVEQMLPDYERAYGLRHACLRYFNAAGADPSGMLGERHEPETHLIPRALQVAAGYDASLDVFGTDYETPDGSCIRDYVHVTDLCRAHLLALQRLMSNGESRAYNLGNGEGYSVKEVIETARKVTRKPIPLIEAERRAGDPARLVADSTRARRELGWRLQYPDLDTIIGHAWAWQTRVNLRRAGIASHRTV